MTYKTKALNTTGSVAGSSSIPAAPPTDRSDPLQPHHHNEDVVVLDDDDEEEEEEEPSIKNPLLEGRPRFFPAPFPITLPSLPPKDGGGGLALPREHYQQPPGRLSTVMDHQQRQMSAPASFQISR